MSKQKETINKSKKYGHVYGIRHKISGGRVAWPHLVDAKESTFPVEEGKEKPGPRFELTYLWPKSAAETEATILQLNAEVSQMVDLYNFDDKTGKKKKQGQIIVEEDAFLKDGDEMDTDKYPFFAGNYVIVPKHKIRPEIYDKNLNKLDPSAVEGGMPCVLVVKPICTATGISFQLLVVQTVKDDGVRFAGASAPAKDLLEALGDEGEAPFTPDEEVETEEEEAEELPVAAKAKVVAKASPKGTLNLDKLT